MVLYNFVRLWPGKRIRIPTVRLVCFYALIVVLTASCSATTSVPTLTTENPRSEVFVVSTFTPTPTINHDSTDVAPGITATLEPKSPLAQQSDEDISLDESDLNAEYIVKDGDALINIALQHDVPMAAIQLANNMGETTTVRVGQTLDIPQPNGWADVSPYWVVYVVRDGESISKIGAKYGLSVTEIVNANDFAEADLVNVGQPIVLPLDGPAKVAAAAQAPLPAPEQPTPTQSPPLPETTVVPTELSSPAPPAPSTTPGPQPPPQDFSGDIGAMRSEVFRLLNEQRTLHGLAPLIWNDILAGAAQKHAEDCDSRGWCGHTGSDGSTMKTRIMREGYDPVRWSECWAWYGTPAKAVEMWMDETPPNDPHRRTILNTNLTEVGVGVAPGNGNGYYYIADFGTPRQ